MFPPSPVISCFYVLFWSRPCVRMSALRWNRLSLLWRNWVFNREPAEEQASSSEPPGHGTASQRNEGNSFKGSECQTSELKNQNPELQENSRHESQTLDCKNQNLELTNPNSEITIHRSELLNDGSSEPCSPDVNREGQTCSCPRTAGGCGCDSRGSCCSEEGVDCVLQVDNGTEGEDGFLQREGSQRRSRRRFRRVNPRGERELITDGQEPAGYNTVGTRPWSPV